MRLPSVRRDVGGQTAFDVPALALFEDQRGRQMQQLGGALQQAGGAAQDVAQEWQHQVDSAELQRADNLMADAIREVTGAYQKKVGADAIAGRDSAVEALEQAREQVEKTLQTDSQRSMFGPAADRRMIGARDELDRHGVQQARVFHEGETLARAEGARVDAVRTFGTPEFAMHRNLMLQQVDELAAMRGLPPNSAQRAQMRLVATTDLHSAVVGRMVDQEPQRAAAYLQSVQGEIEPQRAAQLAKVVRNATVADQSLRLSNQIVGLTQQEDGRIDLQAALAHAQATFDGKRITADVYDALADRLRREDAQRRQFHAGKVNEAQDAAEAWLQQNPNQGPQALPAGLYTLLEQNGKLAELNAFADRGRRATDPQALEEALSMAPQELARLSPGEVRMRYRGRLSPEDLNVVMATHRLAGGTATAKDTLSLRENLEIELAAKNAGILPADSKPNEAQLTAYDRWRLSALQAQELDPKKPMREIVQEMQRTLVHARGESAEVPLFGMSPTERQTAEVVTPGGRRIPIADIVDETGQPMVEQVLSDIRAENVKRAAAGQPAIPETLAGVGAAWERYQQNQQAGRLSALVDEMRTRGMTLQVRSHPFVRSAMVTVADAQALSGLTAAELRERLGDAGTRFDTGAAGAAGTTVVGFDPDALARLLAQVRRR